LFVSKLVKINESVKSGTCSTLGEAETRMQHLVGKPELTWLGRRCSHSWEDNSEFVLKKRDANLWTRLNLLNMEFSGEVL